MQYVGKVGGYVYNQWNALNPATLLGAIDIIVVEQPDGSLHCSPWHVRFGKFQIIRPLQKKIDLYVNDIKTDLPMKLGEGGEAFFVFETSDHNLVSQSVLTSPVISPTSSAEGSPLSSPKDESPRSSTFDLNHGEPEALNLNEHSNEPNDDDIENKIKLTDSNSSITRSPSKSPTPNSTLHLKITFEKARKITQQLNIPSKIDMNGDMVLDMDGYKPNSQKNIDVSDEYFKKIFLNELMDLTNNNKDGKNSDHEYNFLDQIVSKDEDGNIRILNNNITEDEMNLVNDLANHEGLAGVTSNEENSLGTATPSVENRQDSDKTYFKTLRLTSEQLQKMNLHYGENKLKFKLNQANSQIESNLYLWKSSTPIVISDIDGTITKSDALGHVLNLIGRDWTHPGVANLFQDIKSNGYNIIYLTARSVGQADSTRQYLKGIVQEGTKLPHGPVILSPDRTMAALKREVILKKPEVFKMSCLNDIKSLYFNAKDLSHDDDMTPFYAGFGNRITDAISYRSVKIPSHRIFTINPNGEVHMELLELAGYKSSYIYIGELVDHFFPPIKAVNTLNAYWNANQFNQYINNTKVYSPPGSPGARSVDNFEEDSMLAIKTDEKYNDVNYWREPLANLSDLSDLDVEGKDELVEQSKSKSPKSPALLSIRGSGEITATSNETERPTSASSFTSPLKNFMFNHLENSSNPTTALSSNLAISPDDTAMTNDSDYTNDYDDDDDDDDYTDDGYDDDEDDYEDDYDEDEEGADDDVEDVDDLDEEELDEEDLDHDLSHGFDAINSPSPASPKLSPVPPVLDPLTKSKSRNGSNNEANEESNSQFVKASDLMNKLSL
ncbi:uncharacterized protein AC631_01871 [Debaryomyces fabryi]|uniref:LNS2/PITP domain-containing protein n=1 Tax=Debaryomyces fabryi TaxID=58627 RepID=A0A0V1Q1S1_9ASCO|nr:uncharacterized protein AC631_01871 [Debaryomyces fabryi]KSA02407.1 hypothetical protein AC631_01871 [Debaryomyces fabryi]CUM56514.1 unnamed protein product [Debaryomyces fabryi]